MQIRRVISDRVFTQYEVDCVYQAAACEQYVSAEQLELGLEQLATHLTKRADTGWFILDDLPAGLTPSNRYEIDKYQTGLQ